MSEIKYVKFVHTYCNYATHTHTHIRTEVPVVELNHPKIALGTIRPNNSQFRVRLSSGHSQNSSLHSFQLVLTVCVTMLTYVCSFTGQFRVLIIVVCAFDEVSSILPGRDEGVSWQSMISASCISIHTKYMYFLFYVCTLNIILFLKQIRNN